MSRRAQELAEEFSAAFSCDPTAGAAAAAFEEALREVSHRTAARLGVEQPDVKVDVRVFFQREVGHVRFSAKVDGG